MGASDPFLFPQYEAYIQTHLQDAIKASKKVAWLGLQRPYRVSSFFEKFNPTIENHCFDIVPQGDSRYCHKLDVNEAGYGEKLRKEGFDLVTALRISCYMNDHEATVKEFHEFLGKNSNRTIWFEDLDPKPSVGPEPAVYHGVHTLKTKRSFTKEFLEKNFSVRGHHRLFDPNGYWYDQYILSF